MDFYTTLSKFYDLVFPAGEPQLQFFKQLVDSEGFTSALDLACGTGTYTLEFARWGLQAKGLDLSEEMIAQARHKAEAEGLTVEYQVGDMSQLPETLDNYDLVICIGNSLVHLLSTAEINKALQSFAQALKPKGKLVLQIVNYDRILDQQLAGLPLISRPEAGLTFERIYHHREDGLIDFESVLTVAGESWRSSVPLFPLRRKPLEQLVQAAGLTVEAVYGGFNQSPLNDQAQALVLVASK